MDEALSDRFASNLRLLSSKQPTLANRLSINSPSKWEFYRTGKKGELNLKKEVLGQIHTLHSAQNIEVEARQWVGMQDLHGVDWLLIYGVGLGYYYKELLYWLKDSPHKHLVFLEDDLGVLQSFLQSEQAEAILKDPLVDIFYIDLLDSQDPTIDVLARKLVYQNFLFLPLVSYENEKSAFFARLSYLINFKLYGLQAFYGEYLERGAAFFKNFYHNLFQYPNCVQGNSLYGKFKNVPAIICGAGPSLQQNIETLKSLKDKALIFAGGTSMNALNAFNLVPHFGLGVDPFPAQFTRLIMNTAFETPFFFRNRMNYKAAQMIHGPKLYLAGATGYPVANWFDEKLHLKYPDLDEGCNVINMSLSIAEALGCNPIICVGVDLAYSQGQSYSSGIEMHAIHDPKEHFITKSPVEELVLQNDIYGKPVYTLWKWIQESAWFSNFAATHPHTTLVNATEGGLGFSGVPNVSLKEAASHWLTKSFDFDALLHREFLEAPMPKELNRENIKKTLTEFVDSLTRTSGLLREIYNHSPESWENKLSDFKEDPVLKGLDEKLKEELVYQKLLKVLDEHYQKYVSTAIENKQNASKVLDQLAGRYPYLMEVVVDSLKYIEKALLSESQVALLVDKPSPKIEREGGPLYFYDENGFEINDRALDLQIKEPLSEKLEEFDEENKIKLKKYVKEGLLHGPSIVYSKEGKVLADSFYINGKKWGRMRTFYRDGKEHSIQKFKEGLHEGLQLFFYPDGKLKSSLEYNLGVPNGPIRLYFPNGQLKREVHFKEGKREALDAVFYENGKIMIEAEYKGNKPTGTARMWYENGSLAKEVSFSSSGAIENMQAWDESGKFLPQAAKSLDYFDEVTREANKLTHALNDIVVNLEGAVEIFAKEMHLNQNYESDLVDLRKKLSHFKEASERLQKESGVGERISEPLWKTPSSKRLMQQYLEVMTGTMQESMFKMMSELSNLQKKVKNKEDDSKPEDNS